MLDLLLLITNCYLQAVTSSNQTIVVTFANVTRLEMTKPGGHMGYQNERSTNIYRHWSAQNPYTQTTL